MLVPGVTPAIPMSGGNTVMYLSVVSHTGPGLFTYVVMYSRAHVKGKRYTRVSRRLHAGYTQIDNTSHVYDYLGARGLHACYTQHATRV